MLGFYNAPPSCLADRLQLQTVWQCVEPLRVFSDVMEDEAVAAAELKSELMRRRDERTAKKGRNDVVWLTT